MPSTRATALFLGGILLGLAAGLSVALVAASRRSALTPVSPTSLAAGGNGDRSDAWAGTAGRMRGGEASAVLRSEESRAVEPSRRGRRSVALAALHAIRGDEAEFLRLAADALAAGASLDDLLAAVDEFPAGRRGEILAALLDEAPSGTHPSAEFIRALAATGKPERALALARAELPRHPGFQRELSRLLLRLDPEGGASLLLGIEGSQHWDSDDLAILGAALAETGNDGKLVPFLSRALDEHPTDHGLLRLLRASSPSEAMARTQAALRQDPRDPWALRFLGELKRDAGDAPGAFDALRASALASPSRTAFRELVKLDPARGLEFVLAQTKDALDDEMIGAQGEALLLAGRKDEAVAAFLRAHEHDPNDGEWLAQLTALDPGAAVTVLERRIGPTGDGADSRLLGRYARALEAAGRTEDAYAGFLAALRKDPDNDEWQRSIARIDPRAAIPVLEAHVRDHSVDASGHGALGIALAAAGRRADALPELDQALAQGDAKRWYAALAQLDADRALDGLRRRAEAGGDGAAVWALLGRELSKRGQRAEARQAYETAAEMDPSDGDLARALKELR